MALMRFNIKGAILPPSTDAEREWLDDFRARCRILKSRCVIINEGEVNEENITNFAYHICHHDTDGSCEPEQDI